MGKSKEAVEEWRPCVLNGIASNAKYEISSFGRLKSFARDKEDGKILNCTQIRGYKVFLARLPDRRNSTRYLHKLVAETFLEKERHDQHYVIHLDFDKANNHVTNLKWATREDVLAHQRNNPNPRKRTRTAGNAKLDENKVKLIKRMLKRSNNRMKLIAKQFGISQTQLNRIKNGENWGHVVLDEDED